MGIIATKLARLRRRERLIALAWGIARLFLVVFVVLAIACYADWRIDMRLDTPMWLRVGMLAGQIVLAATLLWLWVVRPLVRRRTEDDVALFVEEQTPALGHRLISAVQLNRPNADTSGMSAALIAETTREAEDQAQTIDIRELTDERILWKAGGIVTLVALFAGSAWFAAPKTVPVLLARQMLGDEEIPRSVRLTNQTPEVVPTGEPIFIKVQTDYLDHARESGEFRVTQNGSLVPVVTAIAPRSSDPEQWPVSMSALVPGHVADFTFEAWFADSRLKPPGRVRRVPRPAIIKQDSWTILPAHCGTKPDGSRYRVEQPRAEVVGLPGSVAFVTCKAQKRVMNAKVELLGASAQNGNPTGDKPVVTVFRSIEMVIQDNDPTEALAYFDLRPDESAYRIVVVDEHGFENADPPRRGVKIVSEEPPTVALLPEQFLPDQFPGVGIAEDFEVEGVPIPQGGAIRVAYTASHPYGLGRATLMYRVNEGPWQPFPLGETPETEKTGPFDPRRGCFANSRATDQVQFHAVPSREPERYLPRTDGGGRFDFQTRGLPDLKIGDRIEYYIEVTNRDPNSPQVGRSETRMKTIVTVPQLVQWIDATLRQEDRIRQLEQKQKGVFSK